jgi:hypothetical protein
MKTIAGALILGAVLVAAGAFTLREARLVNRLAGEQQRLATLQYDAGVDDGGAADGEAEESGLGLSLPFSSAASSDVQRAEFDYWRARYERLTPLTGASGEAPSTNPRVLLIAANAMFRASAPDPANTRASVERLDRVLEAYGDVLRADPSNTEAAYNYEYVSRVRDQLARGRYVIRTPRAIAASEDLPSGPTVHGRPGNPPPEVPSDSFKTFSPLQQDERGELMRLDRTRAPRGRG